MSSKRKIKKKVNKIEKGSNSEEKSQFDKEYQKLFNYRYDLLVNAGRSEENKEDLGDPPKVSEEVKAAVDKLISFKED